MRSRTLDRVVHAAARVIHAIPEIAPERYNVRLLKNVVYGPTTASVHQLDVYVPTRSPKPLPVVMYVHGGGFSMLSKETHYLMAMAFARRGYLVFNVNYRLGARCPYPAPLEDVCEALLWVHRHAPEYGGERERIALAGESAGGNLVTALALAAAAPLEEPFARRVFDANVPLRATVATYPFLDITDIGRLQADRRLPGWSKKLAFDAAAGYLGSGVFTLGDASMLANPLLLLERDAVAFERPLTPFFVSAGTRDPILRHAKRLKVALDRHDVPSELFIAPGEIHGFDVMTWRPQARAKWDAVHRFLAQRMARDEGVPRERS